MCCGGGAPAPDYGPMAAASEESARIAAELGREQLDESRRQYDINRAAIEPIVALQKDIMQQTRDQGADYYDYMRDTFRPLERKMVEEVSARNFGDEYARTAAADVSRAQSVQQASSRRALMAMGINPNSGRALAMQQQNTLAGAAQRAGAMTAARERGDNVGYARRMDAIGIGRNLPGASQGAYGLAVNSGNAAAGNQMAPSGQLLNGMAAGAGTTMQGQGLRVQGLGNILNSQTAMYNADSGGDPFGAILGAGANLGMAAIMKPSDRRLKENIEEVGRDEATGLRLYEFSYIGDTQKERFRGVMADEVESRFPDAVEYDDMGFASVNYPMLGIEMVRV